MTLVLIPPDPCSSVLDPGCVQTVGNDDHPWGPPMPDIPGEIGSNAVEEAAQRRRVAARVDERRVQRERRAETLVEADSERRRRRRLREGRDGHEQHRDRRTALREADDPSQARATGHRFAPAGLGAAVAAGVAVVACAATMRIASSIGMRAMPCARSTHP